MNTVIVHISFQRCILSLVHACQCRDANCRRVSCHKMKRVVQHTKMCKKRVNASCPVCKQLIALCCYHAKHCSRDSCSVRDFLFFFSVAGIFCFVGIKRKLGNFRYRSVWTSDRSWLNRSDQLLDVPIWWCVDVSMDSKQLLEVSSACSWLRLRWANLTSETGSKQPRSLHFSLQDHLHQGPDQRSLVQHPCQRLPQIINRLLEPIWRYYH